MHETTKSTIRLIGGLAAVGGAFLACATAHAAVNWTNQGFSPGITGYNPQEKTISTSNVQNLKLTWMSNTSDINGPYSMVEDNGGVFVLSQDQNGIGDVVALNGTTGAEVWKASLNGNLAAFGNKAGIAAGSGLIFAPCNPSSGPGEGLCAFSQKTGTLAWFDNFYVSGFADGGAFTRPTYASGVVYVSHSMCDSDQPTCDDFLALNATSGAIIWGAHASANEYDGATAVWSPAVSTSLGVMYVPCEYIFNGNGDNQFDGVCTFSTSSGTPGWQSGIVGQNPIFGLAGAVSVSGSIAFFQQTSQNQGASFLTALNATTGATLWTFNSVNGVRDVVQPTVAQGAVYWPDGNGTLWSLNAKKGTTNWSTSNWGSACSPVGGSESQPQFVNGVVFITTSCSQLGANSVTMFGLAASNGSVLWQANAGNSTATGAAPMIVSGTLYSDCFQVCAYNLAP